MRDQTRQLILRLGPSALWLAGALGLIAFTVLLTDVSRQFGYDRRVIDMPIITLAALLLTASCSFFVSVIYFKRRSEHTGTTRSNIYLALVIFAGLIARLILFASEPALEDDYQRYLWDGAVTAHGANPYAQAPADVLKAGPNSVLFPLIAEAGPVPSRINHPHLTTIYPPVAQGAFALAHLLSPFSLTSWRTILLLADLVTLGLLLALLQQVGRSPLWAMLYWWNPIVLKEFFNSAHMDALLLPFLLAALLLALRLRPVAATTALALGAGIKIWPILLVPLVWRQSAKSMRQLGLCCAVLAGLALLYIAPYLAAGGLDERSGTAAYAQRWTINSPFFTSVRGLIRDGLLFLTDPQTAAKWGSISSRSLMAAIAGGTALVMARYPIQNHNDFLRRALIIVATLIFVMPAIYPWYTLWMAPLLVLVPEVGLLILMATIPLYYTYFYFAARELTPLFQNGVTWAIWVPVWVGCLTSWLYRSYKISERAEHRGVRETI